MDTRRLRTVIRRIEFWLGITCAVYLALIAISTVAMNHSPALHLSEHQVGCAWLPIAYCGDLTPAVPADQLVRDFHSGLMFSRAGARMLDAFLLLAILALAAESLLAYSQLRKKQRRAAAKSFIRPQKYDPIHAALLKAAPYGDTRRTTRGKVLPFTRR
jgi:uncharacterized iron-regulated membrane protein